PNKEFEKRFKTVEQELEKEITALIKGGVNKHEQ
ncbi:unnamed protein product, partial [marine sediment metagenome]